MVMQMRLLRAFRQPPSNGVLVFNESIAVTGLAATGGVGSAIPSLPENVSVTGVSATMPMTATGAGGGFLAAWRLQKSLLPPADTALKISFQLGTGGLVTGVAAAGDVGSVTVVLTPMSLLLALQALAVLALLQSTAMVSCSYWTGRNGRRRRCHCY